MLLLRDAHTQLKHLRRFAGEAPLPPEHTANLIQPFIDKHKTLRLPMGMDSAAVPRARHPRDAEIRAAALCAGLATQRQRLRGLQFHNSYLRVLAQQASLFDYRGFTECHAIYLGEALAPHASVSTPDAEVWGRVDVAWAAGRDPQVIFEIDSTVKPASLFKLQQAQVPHKYWIYFGPQIWKFKTFLNRQDPGREVVPIILPRAWKP